jgi:hypothetical protein
MDDGELVRWRLRSQRLTGAGFAPTADGAVEVVRWLGAVQSQDHDPALWSVGRRARGVRLCELAAAFDAGAFLRTHVLRPTWHFVPPDELRGLLALTGPRVAAACASRWRELDLPAPVRARATDLMAAAIADRGPLSRPELAAVLEHGGIDAREQRLPHLLLHAELEAVLCSGGLRGRHGPVTERDFAWWSGLTLRDVRHALQLARPAVDHLTHGDRTYWFGEPPPDAPHEGPAVHLVQGYDEVLVAYSESRSLADPEGQAGRMPRGWMLSAAVLVDGRLAGRWRRVLAGDRGDVAVTPFVPFPAPVMAALEAEAQAFAAFLGKQLRLTLVGPDV